MNIVHEMVKTITKVQWNIDIKKIHILAPRIAKYALLLKYNLIT